MVVPESAADRAGVRPGDVIVRFGGVRVYGFDDLRELISARKAGDRVEIAYQRDGGERTVDATLGARQ
jgi:S1-C subfamily serine protease